jgi:hypothetical protein
MVCSLSALALKSQDHSVDAQSGLHEGRSQLQAEHAHHPELKGWPNALDEAHSSIISSIHMPASEWLE